MFDLLVYITGWSFLGDLVKQILFIFFLQLFLYESAGILIVASGAVPEVREKNMWFTALCDVHSNLDQFKVDQSSKIWAWM